ncbi:hypothetical protein [Flavobacterium aquidurense]|nr:hypothetical protein [Flavobacterium aquidurense]
MNEVLSNYYKSLKENLTMIALIPTILGAGWQLWQLGMISIQMIRFFSISQLVNDGLIILLFLLIPLFIIKTLIKGGVDELYKNEDLNYIQNIKNKTKSAVIRQLIYFFLLIAMAITMFLKTENVFYSFYFYLLLATIFSFIQVHLFLLCFQFFRRNKLIEVYLSITTFIILVYALAVINLNFNNIESLLNFQNMISKIEKKDCYSAAPRIRYFNDKYIFIELEKKNKKSILINQIDDLFED